MKNGRKISIGIIFTLAVLFCFGIHQYSYSGNPSFNVDRSSLTNYAENSFSPDIDSFDDDQNTNSVERNTLPESVSQMPIPGHFFLINNFFLSVWQPPKIS